MVEVRSDQMNKIAPLFDGIQDSMVIACLQGSMGNAYVATLDHPKAALIVSGEYSFFGGDAESQEAEILIKGLFTVNQSESTVVIFDESMEWEKRLLSIEDNHPVAVPRFGIVQKDYEFDDKILQNYVESLPEGFELTGIDETLYYQAMKKDWAKEFCETFSSAEEFCKRGFGYVALKNGVLVSGASSMTVYDGGIEIQVATDENYRKLGLAMPCAARLIQECAKRNLRPCWDAANEISLKMALKLGYEYKGEYTTIHMKRKG